QRTVAPRGDAALEFLLALLQCLDLAAQRLDFALAQQRALLGGPGAQHPHPAGADALARAGDHRFAVSESRQQRARLGQGVGRVQLGQDPADRRRALDLGRQRGRRAIHGVRSSLDQGQPAFAEFAQRVHQRFRRLDQHALDQLPERAFDRVLPARLDHQRLADPARRVQPTLPQPFHRRALLLAERCRLEGLQRGQPATLLLRLPAHVAELGLGRALLVLQLGHRLLAGLDFRGEAVERRLLFVVLRAHRLERFRQRGKVQPGALGRELLAAALGVHGLPVEVVHAGALDVAGARRLGLRPGMRVPALLPVGEFRLGLAQRVLGRLVLRLQALQFRLRRRDRLAQRRQACLVAADVAADFLQRGLGFLARALQTLRHFALVRDLLLDPRQRAADLVDLGLCLVQGLARRLALAAAFLDPALGLALLGDQLLQPGLVLPEFLAQALQARIEAAELQRLPLRVLDPALGLDRLVLLGLPRLALEVVELLADFLAQVGQALEVLAGVLDPVLGLAPALLVLGDARGFLQ